MSTADADTTSSLPERSEGEQHEQPEEAEYHTASGITVEISDIEVDVVEAGTEDVVSSQADPQAYGIEPGEGDTSSLRLDTDTASG